MQPLTTKTLKAQRPARNLETRSTPNLEIHVSVGVGKRGQGTRKEQRAAIGAATATGSRSADQPGLVINFNIQSPELGLNIMPCQTCPCVWHVWHTYLGKTNQKPAEN